MYRTEIILIYIFTVYRTEIILIVHIYSVQIVASCTLYKVSKYHYHSHYTSFHWFELSSDSRGKLVCQSWSLVPNSLEREKRRWSEKEIERDREREIESMCWSSEIWSWLQQFGWSAGALVGSGMIVLEYRYRTPGGETWPWTLWQGKELNLLGQRLQPLPRPTTRTIKNITRIPSSELQILKITSTIKILSPEVRIRLHFLRLPLQLQNLRSIFWATIIRAIVYLRIWVLTEAGL